MTVDDVIERCGKPTNVRTHSWGSTSLDYPHHVTVVVHPDGGAMVSLHRPTLEQVAQAVSQCP